MTPPKSDLPQGTLDLLILKVIALGPVHGYAIAQRLEQVSRGVVQVPEGSLYPALHRKTVAFWLPIGKKPKPGARQSFIA
jgi:DNA-binding PadR family transcriptional regulator